MTRDFERRLERVRAISHGAMPRSQFVVWCFEPEKMPAMVDLMIAQGRLSESDRPRCVHWTALKGPRELTAEDAVKMVDADEMLDAAGIRTLTADAWDALLQGMEAFEAFMQERYGGLDPDERAEFEKVAIKVRPLRPTPA